MVVIPAGSAPGDHQAQGESEVEGVVFLFRGVRVRTDLKSISPACPLQSQDDALLVQHLELPNDLRRGKLGLLAGLPAVVRNLRPWRIRPRRGAVSYLLVGCIGPRLGVQGKRKPVEYLANDRVRLRIDHFVYVWRVTRLARQESEAQYFLKTRQA